jgi:hypothetical protein
MKTRIVIGLLTFFFIFSGISNTFSQSPEQLFQKGLDLRKKLEDDPSNPKHIISVRGVGYKFVK